MALTIGELVGYIRADDSGMRRGLSETELRMRGLQRDLNGRLRDIHGRFVSESEAMGRAIGEGIADGADRGLTDAELRLRGFQRDSTGRLRDLRGRFVREGELMGRGVGDGIDNGSRRGFSRMWRRLVSGSGQAGDESGRSLAGRMLSAIGSTLRSGIGSAVSAGLSGLQNVASSISSNPYVAAIGAAIGLAIIPMIGAVLSGAVISLGGLTFIGLGAVLLKDEPQVKKAAKSLVGSVKKIFEGAAKPLVKPFVAALESLEQTAKDVAPQVRKAFSGSAGFVKPLTDGIDKFVKGALPGFLDAIKRGQPVFNALGSFLGDVGKGFGDMLSIVSGGSKNAADGLRDIGSAIRFIFQAVGYVLLTLSTVYGQVRGVLSAIVGAFRWLYDVLVGHSIVPDLINSIVAWFAGLPGRILGGLSSFVGRVIGFFGRMKDRAVAATRSAVDTAVRWLVSLPGRASSVLSGLAGSVGRRASDAANRLVSATRRGIDQAVRWVSGLPGRAAGALGGIGSRLYGAGQSLIRGFISGIRSMVGSVRSAAASVVAAARDFFPFSPAKEGPFSGRGWTLYSGRALIEGFQKGIRMQLPSLRGELQGLGGGLPDMALPGAGAAGGGAGAARQVPARVVLDVTGADADLVRMIRKWVSNNARGDVQLAFGR